LPRSSDFCGSDRSLLWTGSPLLHFSHFDCFSIVAVLLTRLNQGSSWSQILSQVLPSNLVEHQGRLMSVVTQTASVVSGMHYVVSLSRAHLLAISRPPHHTNIQLIEIIIFLLQLLVHDKLPDLHASHAPSPVQSCLPPITPS
jgi:hypothetical protein